MSKLLDVLPEGAENIIKTVLSETDADVIKICNTIFSCWRISCICN